MAKGNDGNYLQHCVEVEAAVQLAQASADGRLHVALTHGMAPFEQIDEPKGNVHCLLIAHPVPNRESPALNGLKPHP